MSSKKNLSRREFLTGAAALSAFLCGGCALSENRIFDKLFGRLGSGQKAQVLRQLITADSKHSRTIMWQSADKQSASLKIREAGSIISRNVQATCEPYSDDGQKLFLYTAHIAGLKPGTRYEYSPAAEHSGKDWLPLVTDNGGAFTALIFPDTQCNDYSVWQDNAGAAFRACPEAAFFINMGDLVDNGEDRTQWTAWFKAVREALPRIPFAPVMGNHETYDLNWKVRRPHAYLSQFRVPENGCPGLDRYFYSFDYGEAHFVVLNTQWDELAELSPELLPAQLSWLEKDMQRSDKKWNIALLHKDVLKYAIKKRPERQPGIGDAGEKFMPLFEKYGFDLVLTAHLHTYRNRGHIKGFAAAGDGPVYVLTGVAGNIMYNDFWLDHELDKVKAPQPETGNYLTLSVSSSGLRLKSLLFNGTVFDELFLKK